MSWPLVAGVSLLVALGSFIFFFSNQERPHSHNYSNNNNHRGPYQNIYTPESSWNNGAGDEQRRRRRGHKKAEPGDKCFICCEIMKDRNDMEFLPCSHAVHKSCTVIMYDENIGCSYCFEEQEAKKSFKNIEDSCAICLEPLEEANTTIFSCGHGLHTKCFGVYKNVYQNGNCPICKKPF